MYQNIAYHQCTLITSIMRKWTPGRMAFNKVLSRNDWSRTVSLMFKFNQQPLHQVNQKFQTTYLLAIRSTDFTLQTETFTFHVDFFSFWANFLWRFVLTTLQKFQKFTHWSLNFCWLTYNIWNKKVIYIKNIYTVKTTKMMPKLETTMSAKKQ